MMCFAIYRWCCRMMNVAPEGTRGEKYCCQRMLWWWWLCKWYNVILLSLSLSLLRLLSLSLLCWLVVVGQDTYLFGYVHLRHPGDTKCWYDLCLAFRTVMPSRITSPYIFNNAHRCCSSIADKPFPSPLDVCPPFGGMSQQMSFD